MAEAVPILAGGGDDDEAARRRQQVFAGVATGLTATAGLLQTITRAQAIRTQGKIQAANIRQQQQLLAVRQVDAVRRGQRLAGQARQRRDILIGRQRAALAAQGIDPDAASAAFVTEETARLAADDIATIKNNARREALGLQLETGRLEFQRDLLKLERRTRTRATLITGGIRFARDLQQPRIRRR